MHISPASVRFLTASTFGLTLFAGSACLHAKGVELTEAPLPKNVVSIAGEVRAYSAKGPKGSKGQAVVSVATLQKTVGKFKTARVFAFDAKGRQAGVASARVSSAGSLTLTVAAGYQYLLYPELNERLEPTYDILCTLSQRGLPAEMVPQICTEILCGDQPFRASELATRVRGLERFISGAELGKDMIGGFDLDGGGMTPPSLGGGTICDRCISDGSFYPGRKCNKVNVSPSAAICGVSDRLVYVKKDGPDGGNQIHIMRGDGSNDVATGVQGADPDVTGDRIVFVRAGETDKLFTMNINGGEVTEVLGTDGARAPAWGHDPLNPFIVFTARVGNTQDTAIWQVSFRNTSGTRTQVTFPAAGEKDDMAAVVDGKNLVFVRERLDSAGHESKQLWIKKIFNPDPPIQLTNIPDAAIREPVCGHIASDQMVAFVVASEPLQSNTIRVSRLNADLTALTELHTISPGPPVQAPRLFAIDFSTDDTCLFFQALADTQGLQTLTDHFELFLISFDGSALTRLTTNAVSDKSPSVVAGYSP